MAIFPTDLDRMTGCELPQSEAVRLLPAFGRRYVAIPAVARMSDTPPRLGPVSIVRHYPSEGGVDMAKLVGLCMASVIGLNRGRMGGRYVWKC